MRPISWRRMICRIVSDDGREGSVFMCGDAKEATTKTSSLTGVGPGAAQLSKAAYRMCKRGFGSPRIWIPHPKTLADLDDPKRGFGSPADLDPSIYFVYDRLENDDVECWEPNPRTPKRGFGSPADLDPDSQRIVEDLFRQVSMSLAHK